MRQMDKNKVKNKFTVGRSWFSPELMILLIVNKIKCVEIPVNYKARIGKSKITGKSLPSFVLGLRMIHLILSYKFGFKK